MKTHSVNRKSKVQNGVRSKEQNTTICGEEAQRGYLDSPRLHMDRVYLQGDARNPYVQQT